MMVSLKLASSMLLFESVFSFLLKMQMTHMVYSVTLLCDRLTCCRFWEKTTDAVSKLSGNCFEFCNTGFHKPCHCMLFVFFLFIIISLMIRHVFLLPRRYFLLKRRS